MKNLQEIEDTSNEINDFSPIAKLNELSQTWEHVTIIKTIITYSHYLIQ